MNAGFSSLIALKRHLLAERLRPEIGFDDQILALGLGAAAGIERYCDRLMGRVVGGTWEASGGDRITFILPRYPIEDLTAVHIRTGLSGAWELQDLDDLVLRLHRDAGVVVFDSPIGWRGSTIRFTWTGGYWWDVSEDDSGEIPTGATELPADIRHAWLLQCQDIWSRRDNLGIGITAKPGERAKLGELDIIPSVRSLLRPHVRHAS